MPGHQLPLLRSDEDNLFPKLPDAGFSKRYVAQSSLQGKKIALFAVRKYFVQLGIELVSAAPAAVAVV